MMNLRLVSLCIILLGPLAARGMQESFILPDGQKLEYIIEYPVVPNGRPAPLCIVMGGGKGDEPMARGAMKKLGQPFLRRGKVVVSPISPKGASFFNKPESDWIISLINKLLSHRNISDDKVLIGGISNGGISALAITVAVPKKIKGVIMVPGLPFNWKPSIDLKGMPIYLRIGEKDKLEWGKHYSRVVKDLAKAHAKMDAKLLKDAGHGFPLNWQEIDKWLSTLQ